jgi:outer membrane lipoprotein
MTRLVMIALVLALAGCARPPVPLEGTYPPVSIPQAQREDLTGERVRWGGIIVRNSPEKDRTCFEIVRQELDGRARPRNADATDGRFVACAPGFWDPEVYAVERQVTVVGTLGEPTEGKVGEYDYRFPQVDAQVVYLWPQPLPPDRIGYYGYPGYYGYGYPGYYGVGFGWGGWGWGGPWYGGYRAPVFVGRTVRPR